MHFNWEKSLILGIKEIDEQHNGLIDHANTLFEALGDKSRSNDEIMDMMKFLAIYVQKHFSSEEQLQKRHKYPFYEEHHKIHEEFRKVVSELLKEIEMNGLTVSKKLEINRMTIDWLKNHIGKEDKKLADYILSKEIENK